MDRDRLAVTGASARPEQASGRVEVGPDPGKEFGPASGAGPGTAPGIDTRSGTGLQEPRWSRAGEKLYAGTEQIKPMQADRTRDLSSSFAPGARRGAGPRLISVVLPLALLVLGATLLLLAGAVQAEGSLWHVAGDGTGDYEDLDQALADWSHVTSGDRLLISPGRYEQNRTLQVNRSLAFIGPAAPGAVIIDGMGQGEVFLVEADNVSFMNLTIRGSRAEAPYAGLHARNNEHLGLTLVNLSDNHRGLYLEGSNDTRLDRVELVGNQVGAFFLSSDNNVLIATTVTDNVEQGLLFQGSRHNLLEGTVCVDNGEDLVYTSAVTHDLAFNSTLGEVTVESGSGSLTRYNSFQLTVVDHLRRPLEGVELNLTQGGTQLYATPAFQGPQATSDDRGTFPTWFLLSYNHSTDPPGSPVHIMELISPMGWEFTKWFDPVRPISLTLMQPDRAPVVQPLGPTNNSLVWPNATVSWQSFDPEGLKVNHTLEWRFDGGSRQSRSLGYDTAYQFSNLPRGSNLSWRVQAFDGNISSTSLERTFRVNRLPVIELLGPAQDHRYVDQAPSFAWQGNDTESAKLTYRLFVDQESWPVKQRAQGQGLTGLELSSLQGVGGNYSWRVEVEDGLETVSSAVRRFSVNAVPRARIDSVEPRLARWPHNVTLVGSGVDDGPITAYRWRLLAEEMGNRSILTLTNLSYGSHQIDLQVQDREGIWSDWVHEVVKLYSPPVADAGMDLQVGVNQPVYFDGSASRDLDGEIAQWEWDFDGDGTYDWSSSTASLTTKRYKLTGQYQAVLRVTDNEGYSDTAARVITVEQGGSSPRDGGDGLLTGASWLMTLTALLLTASIPRKRSR